MNLVAWIAVLLGGIVAIQWGARRVAGLLGIVQARFGFAETAGGALLALATASPEVSINIVSVAFGWPDIGLGTALGSNVPALPLIMIIGYTSMRWHARRYAAWGRPPPQPFGSEMPALQLKRHSVLIQALPYLGVTVLVAILTLPPAWSGLQPIDAVFLLAAFAAYFAQALLRRRGPGDWGKPLGRPLVMAAAGTVAIAVGAVASVWATNTINEALGIPALVGGLFITGLLCALPESLSAWPLADDGRATATASTALADGTISISLAFVPLALKGTAVGQIGLYAINLAAIAAMIVLYIVVTRRKPSGYATGREVLVFGVAYLVYLAAVIYVLTDTGT